MNPTSLLVLVLAYFLSINTFINQNQFVIKDMKNEWIFNNIVHWKNCPPSMLGCFQLYKKKVYHRNDLNNAGYGRSV